MSCLAYTVFVLTMLGGVRASPNVADRVASSDPVEARSVVSSYPIESSIPVSHALTTSSEKERLAYSNTLGGFAIALPSNQWVADDLTLTAVPGCALSRFSFYVSGRANPKEAGGAYRVDYALYDNCPQAGGSEIISGTEGSIDVPGAEQDAIVRVELVVPPEVEVALPPTVWLGVRPNRSNVGVVGGAPALVGYTADVLDFPGSACNADAGGFPGSSGDFSPHASVNAELFVREGCVSSFPTYRASQPARSGFNEGSRWCFADDLELKTDSCEMVALEYGVRLNSQTSSAGVQMRLFRDGNGLPGAEIPGTFRAATLTAGPGAYVVRQIFDPPVSLPGNKIWASYESVVTGAGWILTRVSAALGTSSQRYARSDSGRRCHEMVGDGDWELASLSDFSAFGVFDVTVYCIGDPPPGACCDSIFVNEVGNAVCREVPEMNCAFPTQRQQNGGFPSHWVEGASCNVDPFKHPCGTAACCVLDQQCSNLTEEQCALVEPFGAVRSWQHGLFCGEDIQHCSIGLCSLARTGPSCWNRNCSSIVCGVDEWCCQVEWDEWCVREAASFCSDHYRACERDTVWWIPELVPDTSIVVANDNFEIESQIEMSCRPEETPVTGWGATIYKFTATHSTAQIDTCSTFPPRDTVVAVYDAKEPDREVGDCEPLREMACVDEDPLCPEGGALLCVRNLVVGRTYYIQLASTREDELGIIRMDLTSPCPDAYPSPYEGLLSDAAESNDEISLCLSGSSSLATGLGELKPVIDRDEPPSQHEFPDALPSPAPRPPLPPRGAIAHAGPWVRDGYESFQVNVDGLGNNITGDAANEPSIAVDPNNRNRMAIGWRQFDSVNSSFREAGFAYSEDGGRTWRFPGVLEEGVFRSDPVLDSDADGNFYYYSIPNTESGYLFKSSNGGRTWPHKRYAFGGDKPWMTVDKASQTGRGNIYAAWTMNGCCDSLNFTRSTDGGRTFEEPIRVDGFQWGTMAIDSTGVVYVTTGRHVAKSVNAADPLQVPSFNDRVLVDLGGRLQAFGFNVPNPGGLQGQAWIAVDTSGGPSHGYVYLLGSVATNNPGADPLDVKFVRSEDGGETWSAPIRVNDDPEGNGAWQWFGTMSVAPNGRIDVIWNDTRNSGEFSLSELYYTYSNDAGHKWAKNVPVSPMFDSWVGWPDQNKLGDYYHMVSDNEGVSVAYAATFKGEQDVYFLRIGQPIDCNNNGIPDLDEIVVGGAADCDANSVPDECQFDWDGDGLIDACDDDLDNDGVENEIDECPYTVANVIVDAHGAPRADTTRQCNVVMGDYWRFRNCMLNGRPGVPAPRDACLASFDTTGDEQINLADFQGFQTSFSGSR